MKSTSPNVVMLETVQADVRVPEAYTAAQPVTLYSPSTVAAEAYTKIGRQMKLYR
ncbi:hypothetical protein [Streptomyces sp. NRRL F-5650]|uniref:hypothetical protein n=1 Tax=Streptomyces sp. NRRL F-5650 TaxID=1463868 RepID=UPI000ACF81B4|nr:hypothetical protein [Streptomyces sp. NRRL F-5650]